jgi:hypothetical protein
MNSDDLQENVLWKVEGRLRFKKGEGVRSAPAAPHQMVLSSELLSSRNLVSWSWCMYSWPSNRGKKLIRENALGRLSTSMNGKALL